ncbi:MAG: hypothetical protein IKB07_02490 [Lachnospiraceae bacterium]|nr:hypothetical protein [Lachnospiraceae bacterium]
MRTKKMVASILAIALVMCTPIKVTEASNILPEYTVMYGDVMYHAKSEVSNGTAYCLTSVSSSGVVSVTGTYYYINHETIVTGTSSSTNGGQHYASVSFAAPTNCTSVRVNGSHRVSFEGQRWEVSTKDVFDGN